jgi:exonuclease SbcC
MYAAAVAQRQAVLSTRQTAISGLRDQMNAYALELGMDPSPVETPLGMVVERLIAEVSRQEQAAYEVDDQVRAALATLEEMDGARRALDAATADHLRLTVLTEDLAERRTEADRRIGLARDLAGRAQALRTTKVRQVFNDELNALWRELFIRLAPDEAFVPAFALPSRANGAVEAILETHYRSGGKGGNPRSMLRAGNLNTAALTLFLSLHLSVKPILPWLIIDDPVQSMDDVHIAQFAALLRTLKMDGRQVILAVHDRQLFDYLALEMSPSSNGDRLITIELGRGADSRTTAPWKLTAYEPDTAIAA